MTRGLLNHLDLTVTDLPGSVAFYDQVLPELGYTRSTQYAGEVPCWAIGEFSIGLHPARSGRAHDRYSPGLHHLAFHAESREAVDRFHRFLQDRHLPVLDAPAEYEYTSGYYAVFFTDPDGIKLELVFEPRLHTSV